MFKVKSKNLGDLKVGVKTIIKFKVEGDFNYSSLNSSCGCSKPSYNKKTNTVEVIYTPQPIPRQVRGQGQYTTRKIITVMYQNGTVDKLSFTATIKE